MSPRTGHPRAFLGWHWVSRDTEPFAACRACDFIILPMQDPAPSGSSFSADCSGCHVCRALGDRAAVAHTGSGQFAAWHMDLSRVPGAEARFILLLGEDLGHVARLMCQRTDLLRPPALGHLCRGLCLPILYPVLPAPLPELLPVCRGLGDTMPPET